jgi:hypothetical protein
MRECRVYQWVNQPINHMREISRKNPAHQQEMIMRECRVYQKVNQSMNQMREIQEKSCFAEGKLQAGNMYTNTTLKFLGNIQENSPLETDRTSESRKFWEISRPANVIIQPVTGKIFPARESLISDIPARDRKIDEHFITVQAQCYTYSAFCR